MPKEAKGYFGYEEKLSPLSGKNSDSEEIPEPGPIFGPDDTILMQILGVTPENCDHWKMVDEDVKKGEGLKFVSKLTRGRDGNYDAGLRFHKRVLFAKYANMWEIPDDPRH